MTPLQAIGYAFAAVIVSPVVLGLLILALVVLLMLGMFLWESRKAQVAVFAGALLWFTVPPFARWVNAPSVPKPPQSCAMRCEDYMYEDARLKCLEHCYQSEALIKERGQ